MQSVYYPFFQLYWCIFTQIRFLPSCSEYDMIATGVIRVRASSTFVPTPTTYQQSKTTHTVGIKDRRPPLCNRLASFPFLFPYFLLALLASRFFSILGGGYYLTQSHDIAALTLPLTLLHELICTYFTTHFTTSAGCMLLE